MLAKLADPRLALQKLSEVRERISELSDQAGPQLKRFASTYEMSFGTIRRLMEYGEEVLAKVVAVQAAVEELARVMNGRVEDKP